MKCFPDGRAPAHGRQQPVVRCLRSRAHIHQHECAGTDCVLRHAFVEARLAEGGGLLIAGIAGDRDRFPEEGRHCRADDLARRGHARQHRARHVKQLEQLVAPRERIKVEQQRARRVANVGDVMCAAGQVPNQPGIDRAEGEITASGTRTCARHVVEQPLDLGCGEVRIEQQSGCCSNVGLDASLAQRLTPLGCAAVLPNNRVRDRYAGCAIPDDGGFALIRDPDRGHVALARTGLAQR